MGPEPVDRRLGPAVATDPAAPYVYLLTTRYGVTPPGCSSHCPSPLHRAGELGGRRLDLGHADAVVPLPRDEGAAGHLVFVYEGPGVANGPQRVYASASSHEGRTWSAGVPISAAGEDATGPRLASFGGDARVWYMQTAGGDNPDAWNVWYRSSADGGATWSAPVRISEAPAGAAGYVGSDGFAEIYGDYGEIGVTNTGKTFAKASATRGLAAPGSTSSAELR